MKWKTLQVNRADNVGVALINLSKGEEVNIGNRILTLTTDIPAKHKFALVDLQAQDAITMYGVLVGRALVPIKRGELISTGNIRHAANNYRLAERSSQWDMPDVSAWKERTFMGYHRANGSVGIKNYWLLIPLVFCENKNVQVIHEILAKELGYHQEHFAYSNLVRQLVSQQQSGESSNSPYATEVYIPMPALPGKGRIFENVDGIKLLNHTLGCGGTKDDAQTLCGLLAGYITHANVAGATVLSLGCQNAQIHLLKEEIGKRDPNFSKPLHLFEQQHIGNEEQLIRQAIKQTVEGMAAANKLVRQPTPLSKLCIGLECGGSDGFSGISANPALGFASDLLVSLGASVILSEFPELCGVEQELSDRCINEELAAKFMNLMATYQSRAEAVGSGFDSNPSAGNIRDGLITDAMKSAGAAKKGGSSPIVNVLDYPEQASGSGLTLLCTPGSDIESTTAEVGSGATLVLFTTGLGTPTGNPITPVLKVATNTPLFTKMNDIIDLDAGTIITGTQTPEQVGEQLLEYIIQVASGTVIAKAEQKGHDDFIPWKRGISL